MGPDREPLRPRRSGRDDPSAAGDPAHSQSPRDDPDPAPTVERRPDPAPARPTGPVPVIGARPAPARAVADIAESSLEEAPPPELGEVGAEPTRRFKTRHLTMMALGSAIGAGFFLGTGVAVSEAGPAVLVSYTLAALIAVAVMYALAELAAALPSTGSFSTYAEAGIGRWAGFTVGWMYWFTLVMVLGMEVTGAAAIVVGWFPDVPQWSVALAVVVVLGGVNLAAPGIFGEVESWLAGVKVATIAAFLLIGLGLVTGLIPGRAAPIAETVLGHGGWAPNGLAGIAVGLLAIITSFGGIEIVTIAAAESEEPRRSMGVAIRSVIWRILVFYVGSVVLMICLLPWDSPRMRTSPFASVLDMAGVPGVGRIMEAVVLIALVSAFSANVYASSRMVYSLSARGMGATWLLGARGARDAHVVPGDVRGTSGSAGVPSPGGAPAGGRPVDEGAGPRGGREDEGGVGAARSGDEDEGGVGAARTGDEAFDLGGPDLERLGLEGVGDGGVGGGGVWDGGLGGGGVWDGGLGGGGVGGGVDGGAREDGTAREVVAHEGAAGDLSRGRTPRRAVVLSVALALVSVALNWWLPDALLGILLNAIGMSLLVVWVFVVVAQLRLHPTLVELAADEGLPIRMPWWPWSGRLVLLALAAIAALMAWSPSGRPQLIGVSAFTLVLVVIHLVRQQSALRRAARGTRGGGSAPEAARSGQAGQQEA